MDNQISKMALYGVMAGMLITGTCNSLVSSGLFKVKTSIEEGDGKTYYCPYIHPYLQTVIMFAGETSCWLLLFIKRCYYDSKKDSGIAVPMSPGA